MFRQEAGPVLHVCALLVAVIVPVVRRHGFRGIEPAGDEIPASKIVQDDSSKVAGPARNPGNPSAQYSTLLVLGHGIPSGSLLTAMPCMIACMHQQCSSLSPPPRPSSLRHACMLSVVHYSPPPLPQLPPTRTFLQLQYILKEQPPLAAPHPQAYSPLLRFLHAHCQQGTGTAPPSSIGQGRPAAPPADGSMPCLSSGMVRPPLVDQAGQASSPSLLTHAVPLLRHGTAPPSSGRVGIIPPC